MKTSATTILHSFRILSDLILDRMFSCCDFTYSRRVKLSETSEHGVLGRVKISVFTDAAVISQCICRLLFLLVLPSVTENTEN